MDNDPRIRSIVDDFIVRRDTPHGPTEAELLAAHPDLQDELKAEFQKINLLAGAFAQHISDAEEDIQETVEQPVSPSDLMIRCPHCSESKSVASDTPWTDITCDSCGKDFSLVVDEEHFAISEIGHFSMQRRLGMGSFGTVWQAYDTVLDRVVAVKIPRHNLSGDEAEQFFREARAAAQLKHPNIVAVHEIGQSEGKVFIVNDYIDGSSLAQILSDTKLSVRESVEVLRKLAVALQHAHEAGVIHRDLKPGNLMIDHSGEPFIMDFGLAKRQMGEVTMTHDGQLIGTPAYMAPEQARGQAHESDATTDIYSLGVILYELLTHELPFRGNVQMMIQQVLNDEPQPPRKLNNAIPIDVETICMKCMEKAPQRRFPSATALADELGRFLEGRPILTRPVGAFGKSWRWVKRNPAIFGLIMGILVAIAIGTSATTYWILHALDSQHRAGFNKRAVINTIIKHGSRNIEYLDEALVYGMDERFYDFHLERAKKLIPQHKDQALAVLLDFPEDLRNKRWQALHATVARQKNKLARIGNGQPIISAKLSQNAMLVGAKIGANLKIFDSNEKELQTIADIENQELMFLNEDKWLASFGDSHSLDLFSTETGETIVHFDLPDIVLTLAYAPQKKYLVAGCGDHSILIWDCADFKPVNTKTPFRQNYVNSIVVTPNERWLLTSGTTRLSQWNFVKLTKVMLPYKLTHQGSLLGCCVSPQGDRVCTYSEKQMVIESIKGAVSKRRNKSNIPFGGKLVRYSPDGYFLVAINNQHEVKLLRASGDGEADVMAKFDSPISDVRFTAECAQLVVLLANGEIHSYAIGG